MKDGEKKAKKKLTSSEKLTAEHPIIADKIKKSLKESIKEGSYASAMSGFGISYLTPYALVLNATSSQIGILNGLINLLPSIVQLKASRFAEKFSRRKISIIFTFLQALMFIPIIFMGVLFFLGFNNNYIIWGLIGLITLLYAFGAAATPAWFSWMGSLVPENERGRYFSKRNRITGFFGLLTMLIGALILDKFETAGMVLFGFGILFSLAMAGRLISTRIFFKQYEPRLKVSKKDYFSLWVFLKNGRNTPFGRFTIFTGIMKIAVNIASPFFAVYMLSTLNMSYTWFMAIVVSGSLFQLFFYPMAGRFSDKYGNIQLLRIASISIAITPFLWLVSKNPFYLLTIPQMVGGFAWASFYLATNNYIYDSVRQEKRGLGVAYFNLLGGVGLFVGAGIGSLILLFNISFMVPLLFLFIISGIARLLVYAIFARSLREVRHVKHFSKQYIIREFNPVQGVVREMHHLNNLRDKVMHYI